MSKTVATFIGVVSAIIALHAFRAMHACNITGRVISPQGSVWVYAVNGKDSLKTAVSEGTFKLTVTPGLWKVLIEKSHLIQKEGMMIDIKEGSTMDLGTIRFN